MYGYDLPIGYEKVRGTSLRGGNLQGVVRGMRLLLYQRLPVNLAVNPFSLFAIGRVKCNQRPIRVNEATDVSAQWPATLSST